jgi:hypothetical protein
MFWEQRVAGSSSLATTNEFKNMLTSNFTAFRSMDTSMDTFRKRRSATL